MRPLKALALDANTTAVKSCRGYDAPKLMYVCPLRDAWTLATVPSTVTYSPTWAVACAAEICADCAQHTSGTSSAQAQKNISVRTEWNEAIFTSDCQGSVPFERGEERGQVWRIAVVVPNVVRSHRECMSIVAFLYLISE